MGRKTKKIDILVTAAFVVEANHLCETITNGMKGLEKEHDFKSNEDLILAILRVKAKELGRYA